MSTDGGALLVKPDAANKQLAADREKPSPGPGGEVGGGYEGGGGGSTHVGEGGAPGGDDGGVARAQLRRFYGSTTLDATRAARDLGQIAEEVLQHLNALMGANVEIAIEIQARVPGGVYRRTLCGR